MKRLFLALIAILSVCCERSQVDHATMQSMSPCHRSDVAFWLSHGRPHRQRTVRIEPFTWGATYHVTVDNVSPCCAYTCRLEWTAYNGRRRVMSGGCCYFAIGAEERVELPFNVPGIIADQVTRCELKVFINSGSDR